MIAPVQLDRPEPGFWKTRLVKKGPFVPVWIFHGVHMDGEIEEWDGVSDRGWPIRITALRGGESVPVEWVWPVCARWPIDQTDYEYMMRVREWAMDHASDAPEARPHQPIDMLKVHPPEF